MGRLSPIRNVDRETLLKVLGILLKPIARFCVRHGLSIREVAEKSKIAFVEAAQLELAEGEDRVNISRMSVLTGIQRFEIKKLLDPSAPTEEEPASLPARVVARWESDRRFRNSAGKPRVLSIDGPKSDFFKLVGGLSSAINPATVLFEMLRTGTIKQTKGGVRLMDGSVSHRHDMSRSFEIAARDITRLIDAVTENVSPKVVSGNHHISTEFDNIYLERIPKIRRWLNQEGRKFHQKIRVFLARHDKELSPSRHADAPAKGRVTLTSYSLIDPPELE